MSEITQRMAVCFLSVAFCVCYPSICNGQIKDSVWIQSPAGCKVFNPHPVKNESITWSGPCGNGFADGQGTLTWYRNGKRGAEYVGFMKKGMPHGKGKYDDADGLVAEGEYFNGELHGEGRMVITNKDGVIIYMYLGAFRDGVEQGYGEEIDFFSDGDTSSVYKGQFHAGDRKGKGWLKEFSNDDVIIVSEGDFNAGELEGKAEIRLFEMKKLTLYYNGDYRNGRHGYGLEVTGDNIYRGEWSEGKRNGKGQLYMDSVLIYDGHWKDDRFNGFGTRYFFDGSYSFGEFRDNARHGFSITHFNNGTRYVGEFKNDLFTGSGYVLKGTRVVATGSWKNGKFYATEKYFAIRERLAAKYRDAIQKFNLSLD